MTTLSAHAEFVLVSTNGAASVVLYDPAKIPGHRVTVKNDTAQLGTTTITTAAGNIDGGSSVTLIGAKHYIEFEAWGGNWKIVDSSTPFVGHLGAGVVHSDASGNLTSSAVVDGDITSVAWSKITATPTTLSGYGITNGVANTRSVSTNAPLTGGGDLSTDRTLSVSDATTGAVGVVKLAGDLGGSGASPTVVGLTGAAGTVPVHATGIKFDAAGDIRPGTGADMVLSSADGNTRVRVVDAGVFVTVASVPIWQYDVAFTLSNKIVYVLQNALGNSIVPMFEATNQTAAINGTQQYSPSIDLVGQGYHSGGTPGSKECRWEMFCQPIQSTGTLPDMEMHIRGLIDGTITTSPLILGMKGDGTLTVGFYNHAAVAQQQITDSTGGVATTAVVDVTTAGVSDPAKVNANFASIVAALQASGLLKN